MKVLGLLVLFIVAATVCAEFGPPPYDLRQTAVLFVKFQMYYHREYKDAVDRYIHYQAFKKYLRDVNEKAKSVPPETLGITFMADYTEEEISKLHGFGPYKKP